MPQKKSDESHVVLYHTPDGKVTVNVVFARENFWLTQKAMTELFGVNKSAISKHLKNIFDSGELVENSVVSTLETTAAEAKSIPSTRISRCSPCRGNLARNGRGEGACGIREIPGETGRGIHLGLRQRAGATPERERRTMNQHVNAVAGRLNLGQPAFLSNRWAHQ